MSAEEYKAKGNDAFKAGDYPTARDHFTKAIELDPKNHVLFSNRSGAYASLHQYAPALEDAKRCVELKPDWPKGYSRLGAAYHGLGKFEEAVDALEEGLRRDPGSAALQAALSEAVSAKNRAAAMGGGGEGNGGGGGEGMGIGSLFGAEGLAKLALDPRTRDLADDPAFRASLARVRADPSSLGAMMNDEKMQRALEVLLGVRVGTGRGAGPFGAEGDMEAEQGPVDDEASSAAAAAAAAARREREAAEAAAAAKAKKAKEEEEAARKAKEEAEAKAKAEAEMTDEERAALADRKKRLADAAAEKQLGAQAYSARDFAKAVEHFSKAVDIAGDLDVSFLLNRAAARLEAGELEECVKDCDEAVSKGRELRADFSLVSKALARKGTALSKMGKLEEAVEAFGKALTEHRSADTLKKMQEAEKALKQKREAAYVDLSLSEQERQLGNADFKAGKFPEAVAHYAEALRRGPAGVNPEAHKLYSNLSAAYFKLGALQDAEKAAERCIELAPGFAKGYSRKGAVQFLKRDYDEAMATYRQGLDALERAAKEAKKGESEGGAMSSSGGGALEGAEELRDGLMRCAEALNRLAHGQGSKEELEERRMKAMADPKIRNLLNEPAVVAALDAMQHDPRAAERYLSDPLMREKITRLVSAGIITMG